MAILLKKPPVLWVILYDRLKMVLCIRSKRGVEYNIIFMDYYISNTRGKPLAAENLTTLTTWQVARRGKKRIKVLGKEEVRQIPL